MNLSMDAYRSISDRNETGDVRTPQLLAEEMIWKLDPIIFNSSTTTFLDPCCGRGTLIMEIVKRLITAGHTKENISKRLYAVDICAMHCNILRKRLENQGICITIIKNDALKYKWNMKFDVIVGNPPYQSTEDGSKRKKAWVMFADKFLDYATFVAFITPNSWQKGGKYFSNIFEKITQHLVFYVDANTFFKVGEDIGYWIYNKSASPIEFIETNPYLPIYNKIKNISNKKWHFRDFQLPWVIENKSKILLTELPTISHTIPVYWTANQTRYCRPKDLKTSMNWRVIINNSGTYYKKENPEKYSMVTNTHAVGLGAWGIHVASKEEGENVLTWVRSKLYITIIKNIKTGGFNNPFVELTHLGVTRKWTDQEIYDHFKLTQSEIDLIESTVI